MKVGIAGFAGSGKSTIFQWLTGAKPDPGKSQVGQPGTAKVPDDRLDWLSAKFNPKKTTAAELLFLDTPGLLATDRKDNPRRLGILRDANGLLVIINGYSDSDLADELRRFREELLFADLEVITNRIDKLHDNLKKPRPAKQREADQVELALLEKITAVLEQGKSVATMGLRDDEEKAIRSFQFLTLKPELVLVNIGDDRIGKPLPADLLELSPKALAVPAKLELELEDLSEEDRQVFMQDMGLTGSSCGETLRSIFYGMGQIVFFTIGEDECRGWGVSRGTIAVDGAGQIHTDLARGFVRAEVVTFENFRTCGSLKEARNQGLERLEGKTYVVQDGDIMHIRHSG